MTNDVRVLADELLAQVLARQPFYATLRGIPGYDAEVPDLSAEGQQAHAVAMTALRDRALAVDAPSLDAADAVTLAAVVDTVDGELTEVAARTVEHTVSVMSQGPSSLLALAARARLATPEQAEDHLTRTGRFAGYLDTHVARLQDGAASGRSPVAKLVTVALAQVDGYLTGTGSDVFADLAPPAGWDGAAAWSERLREVVRDDVRPALQRWRDAVAALPVRPDDACGLVHLPGGAEDYDRLVAVHTTLPMTAHEVHDLGRECVADLVERMTSLGEQIGLQGFDAVREAVRASGAAVSPEDAMAGAREAIRRAEAAVVGVFPEPLPPPCEVQPMTEHLGRAGMPPHYTPPTPDGGKVGTYWFNAHQPGAGSGWDLESTAFHEAVPGHHLQLSRLLVLPDVPALQTQGVVTAHAEGWGLYAEVLAGELGLYSSPQAELGALGVQLFRAARLVVDTGIHALGWSREEAHRWFGETVPLPAPFIASEIDRYIGVPGQALAYMVGQREILRLREHARAALGDRFSLAGFHGAVLDSGMVPLPAVGVAVDAWIATRPG